MTATTTHRVMTFLQNQRQVALRRKNVVQVDTDARCPVPDGPGSRQWPGHHAG